MSTATTQTGSVLTDKLKQQPFIVVFLVVITFALAWKINKTDDKIHSIYEEVITTSINSINRGTKAIEANTRATEDLKNLVQLSTTNK